MPERTTLRLLLAFDPDASVWYIAESDVPGLWLEADSPAELLRRASECVGELITLNDGAVPLSNPSPEAVAWARLCAELTPHNCTRYLTDEQSAAFERQLFGMSAEEWRQRADPSSAHLVAPDKFARIATVCDNPPKASQALKDFIARGRS